MIHSPALLVPLLRRLPDIRFRRHGHPSPHGWKRCLKIVVEIYCVRWINTGFAQPIPSTSSIWSATHSMPDRRSTWRNSQDSPISIQAMLCERTTKSSSSHTRSLAPWASRRTGQRRGSRLDGTLIRYRMVRKEATTAIAPVPDASRRDQAWKTMPRNCPEAILRITRIDIEGTIRRLNLPSPRRHSIGTSYSWKRNRIQIRRTPNFHRRFPQDPRSHPPREPIPHSMASRRPFHARMHLVHQP